MSDYTIKPTHVDLRKPRIIEPHYLQIPNLQIAAEIDNIMSREGPKIVECTDLRVLIYNWDTAPKYDRNYKYFIISRTNHLLAEPPVHDAYWLKFFPFIGQSINNGQISIESDPQILSIPDNLNGELYFGCGGLHFGHWFQDTLPTILLSFILDAKASILTTALSNRHKQFIELIAPHNTEGKLLEIDARNTTVTLLKIPKIRLITSFGISQKTQLMREMLERYRLRHKPALNSKINGTRKNIVYFKRGIVDGRKRITNEFEMINYCKSNGIDIVDDPLTIDPPNTIQSFHNYDYFIIPNSSALVNFGYFGNPQSKMILWVSKNIKIMSYQNAIGSAYYLLPFLDRTILVMHSPEDHNDTSLVAPFKFSVALLNDLLNSTNKLSDIKVIESKGV